MAGILVISTCIYICTHVNCLHVIIVHVVSVFLQTTGICFA